MYFHLLFRILERHLPSGFPSPFMCVDTDTDLSLYIYRYNGSDEVDPNIYPTPEWGEHGVESK